jgi:glyoxylase-like metal-dependent hydrolase (beta-lactamase superfamily II)
MKVHRVPLGPYETNCVILEDERTREALVVDGGGDADSAYQRIQALGVRPVLHVHTHAHMDHCLQSVALAARLGVKNAVHADDLPLWRNLPRQVEALMGPGAAAALGVTSGADPELLLKDGDVLTFGDSKVEVMHLPGHSPGGIGLLFRGTPCVVVSGDTLFRDGVGRTDLWGGDWNVLLVSIGQRLFTLPDDTVVWSGHGAETTIGREKANFPY